MKTIDIDRETKIVLLNVLKNGYFTDNDLIVILKKIGYTDNPFLELMKAATSDEKINTE
jgi:hypothetical protein